MAFIIDQVQDREVAPRPTSRVRRLRAVPPAPTSEPALVKWALLLTAAAEKRVAELEARLAYLEGLSTTDELTSALNRRGFMLEFSRAIDAARRGGPNGAVIISDLDGFKAINDHLGHASGDEVLRQMAAFLARRVRKMDAVARLGGDEFAILLVGADLTTARRKCQTLARALGSSPPRLDGRPVRLGASFGVATYDGSETEEDVLHRADMAMYAEKRRLSAAATGNIHCMWR